MRFTYNKYSVANGVYKIKTRAAIVLAAVGLAMGGGGLALVTAGTAHAAPMVTIYSNVPSPQPGNVTSEAFEATSTSEFGGQVQFGGTERNDPTVTVLMSSWGCQNGHWYSGDCSTATGATFSEPVTLNVYNVGAANALGPLVTSKTLTFNIPFRPSADPVHCTGSDAGKWYNTADGICYNGFATPISFDLTGATLPNTAIVTLAYNTSHYGATPYGESTPCYGVNGGCGYDSLNVGLVNAAPAVGSNPVANSDYLNSLWNGAYCDNGTSGTGTLRFDTGSTGADPVCPYQPVFMVTAAAPQRVGFLTGGLTLSGPRQQISFNAFDFGASSSADYGTVEYQNFDYPGGLHFTANIQCATVSGSNARFMFQIPNGFPGLSGLYVVASVHDGGSPGTKDTYGHTATADLTTAMQWCENGVPVTNYTVTGGNAVVHKG
ncbi:MAG TPA: hypothetical protein VLH84_02085 [Patescibacteria group bacterium]|nr:hypothetical protein [Patescibacteria group bacterium]